MSDLAQNFFSNIAKAVNQATGAMLVSHKVEKFEDPSQVVKGRCLTTVEDAEKDKPQVNKQKKDVLKKLYGF